MTKIREIYKDSKRGPKVVNTWTGWRYAALIGGIIGLITLTLYPIAIEVY